MRTRSVSLSFFVYYINFLLRISLLAIIELRLVTMQKCQAQEQNFMSWTVTASKSRDIGLFSSSFADDVIWKLVQLLWWGANWSQRCRNLRFFLFPLLCFFFVKWARTRAKHQGNFISIGNYSGAVWTLEKTSSSPTTRWWKCFSSSTSTYLYIFSGRAARWGKTEWKTSFHIFSLLWSSTWKSSRLVGASEGA